VAIERLKSHKSPGIDQIRAELIKAGGRTISCAIHKLIIAIWNKEELPEEWKESLIVPIHTKGNKKVYIFCLMVEALDHGYILHTRHIHVTRYRIRYGMI
jgi:hypothetical protein